MYSDISFAIDNRLAIGLLSVLVKAVRYKSIIKLFAPMAAASLLVTLTAPLINAGIVRASGDYEAALAAYSVARNLIMMLAAFTFMVPNAFLVLVADASSYHKFRNFLVAAGCLALGIGAVVIFSPLESVILQSLLGLTPPLANKTANALKILLLLPPLAIWRSFSQAILIKKGKTHYWLWGAAAGFLVLALSIALSRAFSFLPGAMYGALVLCISTAADAAVLYWGVRIVAGERYGKAGSEQAWPSLSYTQIVSFFLPLLVTTWIMMVCPTVINAALARTPNPETALAVFAVANSVIFAFESPVVALRNTTLAFPPTRANLVRLRGFCLMTGLAVTTALALVSFTPLINFMLSDLIGVDGEVHRLAVPAVRVMSAILLIISWRQFHYAVLMRADRTRTIALATLARIAVLLVGLFVGMRYFLGSPASTVAGPFYTLGFFTETAIAYSIARRFFFGKLEK